MAIAIRVATRIQDADDFDQFHNWPAGALQMTPDVVLADVQIPVGYTALWSNMAVPPGITVTVAGVLKDLR